LCASICSWAASTVTPGASLAIISEEPECRWRSARSAGSDDSGTKIRAFEDRNRNDSGNTPTTCRRAPLNRMALPTTSLRPLKRSFQ
jgi:hypothetical protein